MWNEKVEIVGAERSTMRNDRTFPGESEEGEAAKTPRRQKKRGVGGAMGALLREKGSLPRERSALVVDKRTLAHDKSALVASKCALLTSK